MSYLSHLTNLLKRHQIAGILTLLLTVGLITLGSIENHLPKTFGYLTVMGACFLLSEFIYFIGKPTVTAWKIKNPKQELIVTFLAILIASLLLVYWFIWINHAEVSKTVRIITMILRLLFAFPIFLLIYFLAFAKYKPSEIGIWNFKYWFVAIPIIILIGGATYLLFPEGMQFQAEFETRGIQGFILLGFLTAAIPEEIARNFFQTRLGNVIQNKSIAWFLVSFFWALQHIPLFAFNGGDNYYHATISALGILPIGLLWGYLNERYKSIIPSVMIHGTNLWGIQNIF